LIGNFDVHQLLRTHLFQCVYLAYLVKDSGYTVGNKFGLPGFIYSIGENVKRKFVKKYVFISSALETATL